MTKLDSATYALRTMVVAGLACTTALAQDRLPQGLMEQDPASKGKTDVAETGFEGGPERPTNENKDATELKLSAGGLVSTGNSRAMSLTGAGKFRLRRQANQLTAATAANYASAPAATDEPMETTLENLQARARYDRFITKVLAAFLATSALRDRFQGLNLRLSVDPGVALYVLDLKAHQLWTEAGYDLQYDVRRDADIEKARLEGTQVDKTLTRHNARLFLGYDNSLNQEVTFTTGLEYIQGLSETTNWRLAWDAGLTSNIADRFAVATTFSLRYDHNPLPDVKKTDAITAVSVVYTLL
ncbi:MAG: DUF481 domain-containing protein [Polyangiaceae bacterium]|nr:DUF481 domain-containing protein [Polyangiaceae bacterium]